MAVTIRPPRLFRLLLALVLCLQSGLAAAQCLRLAAPPQPGPVQVEICTADGIAVVHLGAEGDHQAPAGGDHAGLCLACHGLPQAVLPEPPALSGPAERPVAAPQALPEATPPLGARAPPYAPRAPPTLG